VIKSRRYLSAYKMYKDRAVAWRESRTRVSERKKPLIRFCRAKSAAGWGLLATWEPCEQPLTERDCLTLT
jgi:hypothetical protein